MKYVVRVIKFDGDEVVKELEYNSERMAEKAEMGLTRNLNEEEYYTVIEQVKGGENEQ